MKRLHLLFCAIFLTFCAVNMVGATLMEKDYRSTGDKLITFDSVSGLDWLDLTETNGLTYNFVISQLGSGGQFEGWQVASAMQVQGLYAEFGLPLSNSLRVASQSDKTILNQVNLFLGDTYSESEDPDNNSGHDGFISDLLWDGDSYEQRILSVKIEQSEGVEWFYEYTDTLSTASSDYSASYLSTFLCRTSEIPIPEPTIDAILDFFDESVEEGTIVGRGKIPCLANFRLWLFRQMLETVKSFIEKEKMNHP